MLATRSDAAAFPADPRRSGIGKHGETSEARIVTAPSKTDVTIEVSSTSCAMAIVPSCNRDPRIAAPNGT